jgi:hypothetical protein
MYQSMHGVPDGLQFFFVSDDYECVEVTCAYVKSIELAEYIIESARTYHLQHVPRL